MRAQQSLRRAVRVYPVRGAARDLSRLRGTGGVRTVIGPTIEHLQRHIAAKIKTRLPGRPERVLEVGLKFRVHRIERGVGGTVNHIFKDEVGLCSGHRDAELFFFQ